MNKPSKKYGGFSTKTAREARERKEEAYWASLAGEAETRKIPRKMCICGAGYHENCTDNPCLAYEEKPAQQVKENLQKTYT